MHGSEGKKNGQSDRMIGESPQRYVLGLRAFQRKTHQLACRLFSQLARQGCRVHLWHKETKLRAHDHVDNAQTNLRAVGCRSDFQGV